jgi:trehalose 6-phosphate synthase
MPLLERRMRYEAMMEKLRACSIQQWFADFIESLQGGRVGTASRAPLLPAKPALWSLRSAGSGARLH